MYHYGGDQPLVGVGLIVSTRFHFKHSANLVYIKLLGSKQRTSHI